MRPIGDTSHPAMFYRVPMDVIRVAIEIFLVANQVLPETPLPYSPLAAFCAALGDAFAFPECAAKIALDQIPAGRKICVALRQGHDAMQVLGQDHHGIHMERMPNPHRHECRMQ